MDYLDDEEVELLIEDDTGDKKLKCRKFQHMMRVTSSTKIALHVLCTNLVLYAQSQ